MRAFIGTKAYGLSTETAEFVCLTKEEAEAELKRRYPNVSKEAWPSLVYDPGLGDPLEQRYIRDYPVWLPADMVGRNKAPKDADSLWVITTAYVTPAGPAQESIWGVSYTEDNAYSNARESFPRMKEAEAGVYTCDFRCPNDMINIIQVRITEINVVHNDAKPAPVENIRKPGRSRLRTGTYTYPAAVGQTETASRAFAWAKDRPYASTVRSK